MNDLKPHGNCGNLFTFKDFNERCKQGCLIDYDGYGYLSTETHQTNIVIVPSMVLSTGFKTEFTHVIWFNR